MLFLTDIQGAYELAGVADAASTDQTRPILGQVLLEWDNDGDKATLRVIATDSYMLAHREMAFDADNFVADAFDLELAQRQEDRLLMVEAKAWKKALKDVIGIERLDIVQVAIQIDPTGVRLTRLKADAPTFTLPWHGGGKSSSFPNWKQLMSEPQREVSDATLPCFNAVKLAQVSACISAKPSARDTFPVRLAASAKEGTELKPWYFITGRQIGRQSDAALRSELSVLLMPVRI